MSNPQNDPNLGQNLKNLLAQGFPLLVTGGAGVSLPGSMKRPHIFDGIDGATQAALKTLGATSPYPLREIAELYRTVGNNLDDTINIVGRAQEQGASLASLIKATVAQSAEVGQDVHPDEISIGCFATEKGRVHIEFNKAVRYLVLTKEGLDSFVEALTQARAGLPD